MSEKAYKLGILVGRFQTVHTGHEMMVNKALELCDRVGIFVGSSQESGTRKNPFSYEEREKILRTLFPTEVSVYPLPDIGVGNNAGWGNYVLENVKARFGELPNLLISGKEERRVSWFSGPEGSGIAELYIPKTVDISATAMREFLVNGDYESWKNYTSPKLWNLYPELRELVIMSQNNAETASM